MGEWSTELIINKESRRVWFQKVDYGPNAELVALNGKFCAVYVPAHTYASGQTRPYAGGRFHVFAITKVSERHDGSLFVDAERSLIEWAPRGWRKDEIEWPDQAGEPDND